MAYIVDAFIHYHVFHFTENNSETHSDFCISSKKISQKLHKDGSLAKTKISDFSNTYTKKKTEYST